MFYAYFMKSFAQFNEDIFIFDVFKKKKVNDGIFIEFGAWDGVHLSNCKLLADNKWAGFFIEGNKKRYEDCKKNYSENKRIEVINKFIDKNFTLDNLINDYKIEKIDLLSIDIDGKDLTELKRLTLIKPKVIIIEYNSTIPLDVECEDFEGGNGSSYLSIKNFLKIKNYQLIHASNCNLIFIDQNFNNDEFKEINSKDIMKNLNLLRYGFNNFGEMFFIENKKIVKKEIFKFPTMKNFIVFQPVPKFLRNLTDENGKGYKIVKILYSNLILLLFRPILFFKKIFNINKN